MPKNKIFSTAIVAENRRLPQSEPRFYQLSLPLALPPLQRQKPQIISIPGIPPREKNRYRVALNNKILGERLSLDEALELAAEGGVA